jgi:hypothetical protein
MPGRAINREMPIFSALFRVSKYFGNAMQSVFNRQCHAIGRSKYFRRAEFSEFSESLTRDGCW